MSRRTDRTRTGARAAAAWLLAMAASSCWLGASAAVRPPRTWRQDGAPPAPVDRGVLEADWMVKKVWHPGTAELAKPDDTLIGQIAPKWLTRTRDNGLYLFGWAMTSIQSNVVGGLDRDVAAALLFDFGVNCDMETLVGWDDWTLHASGSLATGSDLSVDVGSYAPVNAVYSGDSLRAFELWAEKEWFDEELSLRVGRLSIGWEYGLDYDMYTQFLSAAFRLNVFALDANDPNFSVIPFSNWGARLRYTPDESWRLQASFMNGYPRDFEEDDKHGLGTGFDPAQGSFVIGEATYQWAATEARRKSGGMPGRISVGGYFDTGEFDTLDGSGRTSQGLGTVYTMARQKVWQPRSSIDRGLDLWTAVALGGQQDIAPVRLFWSGGAVCLGPFASRANDSLVLGFANSWFSDALADQTTETTLETAYSFFVSGALNVMLDLQYVVRPGGTGDVPNALIPGMLIYLTF